jgi:peptidoglycan-associated lipoprotein
MRIRSASIAVLTGLVVASLALGACAPKKPPVARPLPPPPPTTPEAPPPPPPPAPVAEARAALDANAAVLKKYPTWVVTIEGHCDERGTAEYNLALGERRAAAAQSYLAALGIPASRIKTVSYGKEFPFDPGHDEAAWAKNRRAHFVITGK